MGELLELVASVFDRMESKLKDIEMKNIDKVENPEKLKSAIAQAIEVVKKGREECISDLEKMEEDVEKGNLSKEEFLNKADECIKKVLDEAKSYLGKDQTGVKTAKATFSRCVNGYKRRRWKKVLGS